jgi:hypothetical protein
MLWKTILASGQLRRRGGNWFQLLCPDGVGYASLEVACIHFFWSARLGCLRHLISMSGAHQVSACLAVS